MIPLGPPGAAPGGLPLRDALPPADARRVLDDTAESLPDTAATLADEFSKRTAFALLAQQSHMQELQLRLDRMKADFNEAQEERSELLRESNALRDMALEQAKKDDEVLKKYIAMI
jgi:ATP-dependent Clp protease ATP-binding subunit ClpA